MFLKNLFTIFGAVILLSLFIGAATDFYFLALLPVVVLIGFVAVVDFKSLFFFTLLLIPFSIEMTLPGGLGTDFPPELLIIGLMLTYLLYFIKNLKNIGKEFYKHPIDNLGDVAFVMDIYHHHSFLRLSSFCKILTRKILVCLRLLFHGRATY